MPPVDTFLPRNYVHGGPIFSTGRSPSAPSSAKCRPASIYRRRGPLLAVAPTPSRPPRSPTAPSSAARRWPRKRRRSPTPPARRLGNIDVRHPGRDHVDDNHIVWVWLPSGGYHVVPQLLRDARQTVPARPVRLDGRHRAPASSGNPPPASPDTTQPATSFNNNHYLVEPIVTAEIVIPDPGDPTALSVLPATVDVGVGATEQLVGQVSWEGISPTNETAFTDLGVRRHRHRHRVDRPGSSPVSPIGSATVTGTYAGFTDTCAVTVAAGAGAEHAWTGADPTAAVDAAAYELGTVFSLSRPDHAGRGPHLEPRPRHRRRAAPPPCGRRPRSTGSQPTVRRTIDLPDLMPTGWSEHLFATPYAAPTGVYYFVTYNVDGGGTAPTADYGAVTGGLTGTVDRRPDHVRSRTAAGSAPPGAIPTDRQRRRSTASTSSTIGEPSWFYLSTSPPAQ